MEVAIYPFKCMRITQRHDEGNHLPHWKPFKNYSDKPWDEALDDAGRSYFCPQNEFKIEEKIGNETNGYSLRLISVNKLKSPFSETPDYLKITLTHLNKDDFNKVKVGQVIHKNECIIREGTSGQASGNHFHCTANRGKYYGFKKNSNGKYCFAYEKSLIPTEAFYIDEKLNKIYSTKNYKFKSVNYKVGSVGEEVEKIDNYISNESKGNFFGVYSSYGIKAFQKINKLNETGEINLRTFEKLLDKGVKL